MEIVARVLALNEDKKSHESSRSLLGQTVSHYQVLKKLGSGGMGVVYQGRGRPASPVGRPQVSSR